MKQKSNSASATTATPTKGNLKKDAQQKAKNATKENGNIAKALDKANLANAGRGAMLDPTHDGRHTNNTGRMGKYTYPEDVKSPEARKAFRRQARAALRKFDSAIKDLAFKRNPDDVKKRHELEKDMKSFVKQTYTEGVPLVTDVAGDTEK